MMQTQKGTKRPRNEAHNKPLKFIPGLTLSQHPPEQRKDLFLMKLKDVMKAKSMHPTEFEGYTVRERFAKMGWEQLLNFKCDKIYRRVVIQWTASLSRNGDELTGIVDGKSYIITPTIIRDLLKVDTRTDLPYARFKEADLQTPTDENKRRWIKACTTAFGTHEDAKVINSYGYEVEKMIPLVQIMWRIGVWTFHPRIEDMYWAKAREIYLLHALFTGDHLYSFAHLMIDDIWDMYEQEQRNAIPHGYYISEILNRLGAVSKDEYVEVFNPKRCLISRDTFHPGLVFSESSTEYIIDAYKTELRVTFPKKVKQGEVPRQPAPQFGQPSLKPNLQNLTNKQSAHNEKQHKELMTMITNLKKQMEGHALEAKRSEKDREKKAEEREKSMITNIHKQMEDQALEAKRRELGIEKQAEEREKSLVAIVQKLMEDQALEGKLRELEIEKRAEEREKSLVAIVQKQMEDQALEAKLREPEIEKRAEEREKSLVAIVQKQMEDQSLEAKRREQEIEKRAEEREKSLVAIVQKQMEDQSLEAKRREVEIEKRAEEREKSLVTIVQKQMEDQSLEANRHELDIEKRAEEREKSVVAIVQKQMKDQALEAKHRELEIEKHVEEREKSLVAIVQKQMKDQALEAKGRELEIEKRAEEREKTLVAMVQKQMEEMERRAEIRTHAVIWDIERQRYLYEQEQDQLRMTWNQINGVDAFQFPNISHSSFHPPQAGSIYYNPTQGDEIPNAFQSIYRDIYGPRH